MMRSTSKSVLAVAVLFAAVGVTHAADSPEAAARSAVTAMAPQAKIEMVEAAPIPGFQQVMAGGHLIYVSNDGKYAMQGNLYDAVNKRDLTGDRLAVNTRQKIDAVPDSERIIFAPKGKPKYTVTIFTDLDCGYCRKLHSQVAEYNKLGIQFDYLFFPRTGIGSPSYDKAVSVWCAKDRKTAFTEAKEGKTPSAAKCKNPVADEYNLGIEVGVAGTPTILTENGTKIGGYMPPDQMLRKLESLGGNSVAAD